jgi:aromatic-L-amino-acid decarboxylase
VLMVRESEWLERAFSHEATYVPHEPGEQDAVDRTLEYSRPFRSLKLWLALRVHGLAAYRSAIERNLSEARLFADLVRERDELELLGEPELSVVPFRHIATSKPLDEHNRALAAALRADGRVYVSGADIDGTACLRPCFVNFRTSPEDVQVLRDVVLELGAKLA